MSPGVDLNCCPGWVCPGWVCPASVETSADSSEMLHNSIVRIVTGTESMREGIREKKDNTLIKFVLRTQKLFL